MGRIGRYIFARSAVAFSAVVVTLTAIVWVTQALRRFDLVTAKGQAILVYLGMTLLAVPSLVAYVAPFALVVGAAMVLNGLHGDSELVAMNAAGASHRRILAPFLALSLMVAALCGWIALWSGPQTLQSLRDVTNAIRADIVANVVQPGRFIDIDDDFTFHIRNRAGDGSLEGLFIHDGRDRQYEYTYSAERGRIAEIAGRTLIVMEKGTVERTRRAERSSTFVEFGSYAFDLTDLVPADTGKSYQLNERTIGELLALPADDPIIEGKPAKRTAEILGRLATLLYPPAMMLALFLFMGFPKTTRSGRVLAILGGLGAASLVRLAGFGVAGVAAADETLAILALAVPAAILAVLGVCVFLGIEPFVPRPIARPLLALGDACGRLAGRFGVKGGAR